MRTSRKSQARLLEPRVPITTPAIPDTDSGLPSNPATPEIAAALAILEAARR